MDTIKLKAISKELREIVENQLAGQGCTFWACEGKPENNRIKSMITCSNCQVVILINREIKKLNKLIGQ